MGMYEVDTVGLLSNSVLRTGICVQVPPVSQTDPSRSERHSMISISGTEKIRP